MRHTLTYANKNLSVFNTFILDQDGWDSASRIIDAIQIPGRNGTLTPLNSKTFSNKELKYECYIPNGMQTHLDNLSDFLNSFQGYQRLEDSIHSNYYRMARFNGSFSVDNKDKQGSTFVLEFDCMPQKWLKTGQKVTTLTANGSITNPTNQFSKPILKIYGSGEVAIGSFKFKILTPGTSYIEIDCETLNAYEGLNNRNSNVQLLPSGLSLAPGSNGIVLGTGITKIEIIPRWYLI